ncbi:MAG: DedA family protein [Candidatus Vogelbacteria bacterium]|nr:DedA family protein [Candidatus Vogelbacteria bacterium]
MSFLLDTLIPLVLVYKYWALFGVCFFASLALPLPSNTAVTAMAVFAASGYISLPWVLATAFGGYVLGDWLGFWLARLYGPKVLKLAGFRRIVEYRYYLEAGRYVNKHPGPTIFLTRFLSAAGPAVNILAGLSKVSFKKFLVFDILGEGLDTLIFGLGGYFWGDQWQNYGSSLTFITATLVVVLILIYEIFSARRKNKS